MKNLSITAFLIILCACSNHATSKTENKEDSASIAGDNKVDSLLLNDDSMIKAKEKELLEKYK